MSMFGFGAAPAAGAAPKPYKPSILAILDNVLGNDMSFGEAKDAAMERHERPQRKAAMQALMDEVLTNPEDRLAFLANQAEWGKAQAANREPQQVTGGNTLIRNGQPAYTAPKLEMSGDSGVSLTPDGMQLLGQRPESFAEKVSQADKEVQRMIQLMTARSQDMYRRNQIDLGQQRLDKPSGMGGSFRPQPTGRSY